MKALTKPLIWIVEILMPWLRGMDHWMESHPEVRRWGGIFRLGLFQFGVGLSLAPITGTLNRVLIDDLGIAAVAVGFLIAIPYFVSPVRAIVGYRSDKARSLGKWRTPYLVLGVMLTYGGLACAPFALILLSGDGVISFWPAMLICSAIFLAYGAGISIVETIYLALVSDITEPKSRGQVLSVLWMMLIMGTVVSAVIVGRLLVDYSHRQLIEVMQGSAVIFVLLTVVALWRQEQLNPDGTIRSNLKTVRVRLSLMESLKMLANQRVLKQLLTVIFIATMAFATHDVLLEPYGGQVLGMSVSATMELTALWGLATIVGVVAAGLYLWRKGSPVTLITVGCVVGLLGFTVISFASDAALVTPFRFGVAFISIGRGLFLVGTIITIMSLTDVSHAGLFLGVWGIVQAMAQGIGIIGGGIVRDVAQALTQNVVLGYTIVYGLSVFFLLSVVFMIWFRLGRDLKIDDIRVPWEGMEEIPADQLAF